MTDSLQKAFEAAAQLPPSEQDAIASWILAELGSESKWNALFEKSQDVLAEMAKEALAEHDRGETRPLEFD